VVLGRWLYVIGGETTGDVIDGTFERAEIGDDGSLGPFELVPQVALAKPRIEFGTAVVGPWLYVFGGFDGVTQLSTVERVRIAGRCTCCRGRAPGCRSTT
jgi:hypothetical protein